MNREWSGVMKMESISLRRADLFYSAIMLNTELTYRNIHDLTENHAIKNYRDLYDKDNLKRIVSKNYGLRKDTVLRIDKLLNSFGDIDRIVNKYLQIAQANNINEGVLTLLQ